MGVAQGLKDANQTTLASCDRGHDSQREGPNSSVANSNTIICVYVCVCARDLLLRQRDDFLQLNGSTTLLPRSLSLSLVCVCVCVCVCVWRARAVIMRYETIYRSVLVVNQTF